jgi:hypothetical protein
MKTKINKEGRHSMKAPLIKTLQEGAQQDTKQKQLKILLAVAITAYFDVLHLLCRL